MKKLNDEKIIEKIININPENKIIKIYRKEKFGKTRIYVDYICGECGHMWIEVDWESIKRRKTKYCNKCKNRQKKYDIDFIEKELIELGFNWLNKEQYIDASSSLETQCVKCGKISKANVLNRIIDKRQCKRCAGFDPKGIEEFKKEVYELEKDNYTVLSNAYTESHSTNILIRHNKCGNEYLVSRSNFRKGRRCPYCNMSKGESRIEYFLTENNLFFEPQKTFKGLLGVGNGLLSYDFYLSDYNLLIEYQGEYHDGNTTNQTIEEFNIQQEHDKRKREYAEKNDYRLLEIWYWDFDNIEEILKGVFENE